MFAQLLTTGMKATLSGILIVFERIFLVLEESCATFERNQWEKCICIWYQANFVSELHWGWLLSYIKDFQMDLLGTISHPVTSHTRNLELHKRSLTSQYDLLFLESGAAASNPISKFLKEHRLFVGALNFMNVQQFQLIQVQWFRSDLGPWVYWELLIFSGRIAFLILAEGSTLKKPETGWKCQSEPFPQCSESGWPLMWGMLS